MLHIQCHQEFTQALIQQIFIEHLLCTRHYCTSEQNKQRFCPSGGLCSGAGDWALVHAPKGSILACCCWNPACGLGLASQSVRSVDNVIH